MEPSSQYEKQHITPLHSPDQWLQLDLLERNRNIDQKEKFIHAQASIAVALVAGTAAMLGSSLFASAGMWRGPLLLALALVFAGIALRTEYSHRLIFCNGIYIQSVLLPKLGRLYGTDPTELYGWEEAFGQTYARKAGASSGIGEALIYGVPGLTLFGFGAAESFRSSFCSVISGTVATTLLVACLVALIYVLIVTRSTIKLGRFKASISAARSHDRPKGV